MQFIAGFPQALGMERGTVRRVHKNTTQCLRPALEPRLLSPERSALTMGPPLFSVTNVLCQYKIHIFPFLVYFEVDVRPTLEMLRNAGIKVTQRQKEALCKFRTLSLFHSCILLFIHPFSLFLCNSYN